MDDQGQEVRWDKDAATVEIGFALFTGALVWAAVFGLGVLGVLVFHPGGAGRQQMLEAAALAGGGCGVWRVVVVLRRFDAWRRDGT